MRRSLEKTIQSTSFDKILVPNRKLLGSPSQTLSKLGQTNQMVILSITAPSSRCYLGHLAYCVPAPFISFPRKQPRETPPAMTTTMDGWRRSNLCTTTGSIRAKCCTECIENYNPPLCARLSGELKCLYYVPSLVWLAVFFPGRSIRLLLLLLFVAHQNKTPSAGCLTIFFTSLATPVACQSVHRRQRCPTCL